MTTKGLREKKTNLKLGVKKQRRNGEKEKEWRGTDGGKQKMGAGKRGGEIDSITSKMKA